MKKLSEILSNKQIKCCREIVAQLTAGHNSLNESANLGEKYLATWRTDTKHPANSKPGNYIVLKAVDSKITQKLLKIDEEVAIGYFLYKAKYVGNDNHGSDKTFLTIKSSHLRMGTHFNCRLTTKFETWILQRKAANHHQEW